MITLNKTMSKIDYQERSENWNLLKDEIIEKGMDISIFNNFDFNQLNSKTIRFAYAIIRSSYTDKPEVDNLDWQFDAKGKWRQLDDDNYDLYVYDKDMKTISGIDSDMIKVVAVR